MKLAKFCTKEKQKYSQTLEGHTEDCLKILKTYIEKSKGVINQFCRRWDLNHEHFLKNIFLTVYLHDIGKLTEQFQKNIKEERFSQKYPHPFFAFPIILNLYRQNVIEPLLSSKEFPPVELCSILGHHTQLYNQIYSNINTNPKFLEKEIKDFINKVPEFYKKLGFNEFFKLEWKEITPEFELSHPRKQELFDKIKDYISNVLIGPSYERTKNKIKLKSVYCFFHSILKLCDDYASANFHEFVKNCNKEDTVFHSVLENTDQYVISLPNVNKGNILRDPKTKKRFIPYPYQNEIYEKAPKFCLLFAPCGRGKTEASLLWAFEVCRRYNRNKIIFAMPTQITSNSMYNRFCELFGRQCVGLYHGKSFLEHGEKLKEEKELDEDEQTDEYLEEIRGENFKGEIFFKPITITTIDHLILSFVHGFRQADFALGNLQNAVIIFDEVHYYEKSTLEHLITLFEILKEMEIPNLLMSGTLPEFFIRKVKEINPEYYGPIVDKEGLNFKPFKVEILDDFLIKNSEINKRIVKEIIENYKQKLNQFIILNTVKRSQKLYGEIKKELIKNSENPNIFLLHSEFTWEDRRRKEELLIEKLKIKKERPIIFVSTQVMELSLDISCDKMYTELAPADAIGQRGGRLNRGAKEPNGAIMKIFKPEEFFIEKDSKKRPYDFDILERTLNNIENGEYSYEKIRYLCDRVYEGRVLEKSKLREIFEACCLFGYSPRQIAFSEEEGRLLKIRDEKFQKMDVIPMDIFRKKIDEFCKKNSIELDLRFINPTYSAREIFEYLKNSIDKEDFEKLRRTVYSVRNEGKVPLYIYSENKKNLREGKTGIKLFDFMEIKKKWFRFTWLPYSKEIGFRYKSKIKIESDKFII